MTLAALVASIMLSVSGHQVTVVCVPQLSNMGQTTPDRIELNMGVCRSLETLLADPAGTKLHYSHPAKRDWYETFSLLTMLHEAEHLAGVTSEDKAQCGAVSRLPHWLAVVGVPTSRRPALELDAAEITSKLPAAYQGCGVISVQ